MTWYVRAIPYDPDDFPETGQPYLVTAFDGEISAAEVGDLADDLEDEVYLSDFEEEASISIGAAPDVEPPPLGRAEFFAAVRESVENALTARGYTVTNLSKT